MKKSMTVVAALALAAAPGWAYKLVEHAKPVTVAKSVLTVTPAIDWNRAQSRPGRNAEAWTLDGLPLNEVTFYGGIAGDQTLFKEVDKKNKPLPRFAANMLATDVAQLFEQSYRIAGGSTLFQIDGIEPARFADNPGFRFRYSFALQGDEVKRQGEAAGAIVGGRLYLIAYEAPVIHYFDRNLADYRALVATATIPGPSVKVS
ncbi:hypothetical protein [Sphingomonas rubra]|uniref:Uncharacterized protein n=1 Tax=Sphingomonas rubra TaxID=634430 RepID=A0A1I5QVM7_9SPHN|nr:hypothetical protein [Sphingomonas rubra]SFP50170.1 hypothetical protein SAMN04488241_102311 [Sphingomonas rubra]